MRKKIIVWVLSGVLGSPVFLYAQHPAGEETDYRRACQAYEQKTPRAEDALQLFLKTYPDTRKKNEIQAMLAGISFENGKYQEAICLYSDCRLFLLSDKERDMAILRLATSYEKTERWQEAAIYFRMLEEQSEEYRNEASYHLAYIDYREGRLKEALRTFLRLQADERLAAWIPYYIADIYLQIGQPDKAEIVAQNFLSVYPASGQAAEMKRIEGEAQYAMGQYTKAANSLSAYREEVNGTPRRQALYKLGLSLYHIRVYSQAAAVLAEVTRQSDALSQNAYLHIGLSDLALRDLAGARMAFQQAASMDYDPALREQALYNYALCVHETAYSPFDESVKVFERFLNEYPASPYASRISDYLTEVYLNTRSYRAALASIDKIDHPDARILKAKQQILFRLGTESFANAGFRQAESYFTRSLELARYDRQVQADAYYWRGECAFRLERYREAERDFRLYLEFTSSKSGDTYSLALYGLGYAAFKQKQYAKSLNWFSKFVESGRVTDRRLLADAYNRIGDARFYARQFPQAREAYARAVQEDPSLGDYALYQEAFLLGLEKDYAGKVETLGRLIGQYPQSAYLDEALYQQGRAYVQMEEHAQAIRSFRELVEKYPQSEAARKGAGEIGLLYYQTDNYPEAIRAYKYVVTTYPGSEEARLAQRDLRSVYVDMNRVEDYLAFASSVSGGIHEDAGERDSLSYLAAERVYARRDLEEARRSFNRYLASFPSGAFRVDAHYYLGLMDYNENKMTDALSHFSEVLRYPANKFSPDALEWSAAIRMDRDETAEALELYGALKQQASTAERKRAAGMGILRAASRLNRPQEVIVAATDLLSDAKLPPEWANEARYCRAKAYLSQHNPAAATVDLKELSGDTRSEYGAEAKYQLAQIHLDAGETAVAEKELLDFIDQGTPHAYWLARSFILLSDVYRKMGRETEARQYLLSLKENYPGKEDDIASLIENRLKKMTKGEN